MSQILQASQSWWRVARPDRLLLVAMSFALLPAASAHDVFTNYVQHAAKLVVGARHVDLTLELTFFEEWSARERRVMDRDGNGRISRAEVESYLKQLAPKLSVPVTVRVAGRELELVPLYEPELELLANDEAGFGHHRLRLFFFAPTPANLCAKDEIVVEDRLWPEARFLGTTQAEGRDGCKLSDEVSLKLDFSMPVQDSARKFQFRCLQPPSAKVHTAQPTAP